jgi:GT2 family glycosyltransferase
LKEFSKQDARVILILNERNLGVADGRNAGYRRATGEFVLTLDDDSSINPIRLIEIPALFQRFHQAGILALGIKHQITREWQNYNGEVPCDVCNYHGAGHIFKRQLFEVVGFLDSTCSFGAEELDYSIRARVKGYTTVYLPSLIVYHNSNTKTPKEEFRRIRLWVFNFLRVLNKHFPHGMAIRYALRYYLGQVLRNTLDYGPKAIFQITFEAARGIRQGLREYTPIPSDVVEFYNNPDLRPEYGNVPISVKLWKRFISK